MSDARWRRLGHIIFRHDHRTYHLAAASTNPNSRAASTFNVPTNPTVETLNLFGATGGPNLSSLDATSSRITGNIAHPPALETPAIRGTFGAQPSGRWEHPLALADAPKLRVAGLIQKNNPFIRLMTGNFSLRVAHATITLRPPLPWDDIPLEPPKPKPKPAPDPDPSPGPGPAPGPKRPPCPPGAPNCTITGPIPKPSPKPDDHVVDFYSGRGHCARVIMTPLFWSSVGGGGGAAAGVAWNNFAASVCANNPATPGQRGPTYYASA